MAAKTKPAPAPVTPPAPAIVPGAWRVERATIQPGGTLTDRQLIGPPAATPTEARAILDRAYQEARDEQPRPSLHLVYRQAES